MYTLLNRSDKLRSGDYLHTLKRICREQKTVSTSKLKPHIENMERLLKRDAEALRRAHDQIKQMRKGK